MDSLQYVLPFLGLVFSALISWAINNTSRKQRDADASSKITDAAVKLVTPLQNQVDCLETDIDSLRDEIVALRSKVIQLRKGVRILTRQIQDAGLTPLWQPEDEEVI